MNTRFVRGLWVLLILGGELLGASLRAESASQITQYGITWTFDNAYPTGRFVTGDSWVVGPVTVVSVSPAPGVSTDTTADAGNKSRYGATALVDDKSMRNGSMVVTGRSELTPKNSTGFEQQGYDSRSPNYEAGLSITFPHKLETDRSLISTVSNEARNAAGKLATPFVLGEHKIFLCQPTLPLALQSAAVLTCLPKAPPPDAFRPPYVGTTKPIYLKSQLRWDLLPGLKPVASTPNWATMERIFERPWLDHTYTWHNQYMLPGENGPNYGREFARMSSIAALMVMLDVPREKKETLLIRYVQLGIDLAGVAQTGRQLFSDGGHWQGRKWPILFASLMLDAPELRDFPQVDPAVPVYGRFKVVPGEDAPAPTTLFQEDLDTYYGKGGDGQTVLWQVVTHTGFKLPHEQKPRAEFDKADNFVDAYRANNACFWIGVSLAARWMKARAIWNHDAFFDYMDRWMGPDEKWDKPTWLPKGCERSYDLFTEDMWNAYRDSAPAQPDGKDNLKWVWAADGRTGSLVPNPKGSQ
jgi:hypothetical protein